MAGVKSGTKRLLIGVMCILPAVVLAVVLVDRGAMSDPLVGYSFDAFQQEPVDGIVRSVAYANHHIYRVFGIGVYVLPILLLFAGTEYIYGKLRQAALARRNLFRLWSLVDVALLGAGWDLIAGRFGLPRGGYVGGLFGDIMAALLTRFGAVAVILFVSYFTLAISRMGRFVALPLPPTTADGWSDLVVAVFGAVRRFAVGVWRKVRPPVEKFDDGEYEDWTLTAPVVAPRPETEGPQVSTPGSESDSPVPIEPPPPQPDPDAIAVVCSRNLEIVVGKAVPPLRLLQPAVRPRAAEAKDSVEVEVRGERIREKLAEFGVAVDVIGYEIGSLFTRYELRPAASVKLSKIRALVDDVALALGSTAVRFEAPIPGRNTVGVEIPNSVPDTVPFSTFLHSSAFRRQKGALGFPLGVDVTDTPYFDDLAAMPHLLVAGATGSGKSVFLNSLLCSLLFRSPATNLRLLLIDVKRTELSPYNGIPHLVCPVLTESEQAGEALGWAVVEMERRYDMVTAAKTRNITEYNHGRTGKDRMPYLCIVIDELADLMMTGDKELEDHIVRLAQKARAVGIHLVLATQRPSVNVVTGRIKANVPARLAFRVSSMTDSRVVLDENGAEKLVGYGDMLFRSPKAQGLIRLHGAFVGMEDVGRLVDYWRE
jgi:DNA segregation ATPase FtsK/SpoIIIE, S-DNA-T family